MNLQAKAAYDAGIIKGSLEGDKLYLRASEKLTRLESIAMLNNTIKPTRSLRICPITPIGYCSGVGNSVYQQHDRLRAGKRL
jgi:hypothetical protein